MNVNACVFVFVHAGIGLQAIQRALMWRDKLRDQAFGHWLREEEKPNKNRHSLYKMIQCNCRCHVPPAPALTISLNHSLIMHFFYDLFIYFLNKILGEKANTLVWENSAVTSWAWERLDCPTKWEAISSSGYLLQSSLSGMGQFTWMPVCLAYHYVSLCFLTWPVSTQFNWFNTELEMKWK